MKLTFLLLVAISLASRATADDWPQWRGPKLNSLSNEVDLPDSLDETTRLWRYELPGPGGASPIVWGDHVFVASVKGNGFVLLCFTTDGKLKWERELEGRNPPSRIDNSNGASGSPVTDGQNVWVMLSSGVMHCFDFAGNLVWKRDLQKEYGQFDIQFGYSSSPLLDAGRLYIQLIHGNMRDSKTSRGKIIAMSADSGEVVWQHERLTSAIQENKHGYTSPVIFRNKEREFLVVHAADFITGHRLKDGAELWRVGGFNPKSSYNGYLRFVASPVCNDEMIIAPSAKGGPVYAISSEATGNVADDGEAIQWKLKRGTPDVATPVISEDRVYLARENGVLICLDAETGKPSYSKRIMRDRHRSTPVVADGKVYLIARDGTALVIADQEQYQLISKHGLGEDTTASPAIANGKIFVRTNQSLMAFGK